MQVGVGRRVVLGSLVVLAAMAAGATPALAETAPTIAKSFASGSVSVGTPVDVTFAISNPNATPLTGVAFSDPLPAGLVVSSTTIVYDDCGGTTSATPNATSISLTGGSLAGNGSCTIDVELRPTSTGMKDNTTGPVSSTESGPGATSNTASVDVTTAAPSIGTAFSSGGAVVGAEVGVSFTLTNPSGNGPLTGVAFSDTLPDGLEVANPSQASNGCGETLSAAPGGPSVSLTGGTIPDGTTCLITLKVKATTTGDKSNTTSTLTSNEAPAGAAAFPADLTVVTAPTFTKDFAATMLQVGDTTSLSFSITNPAANPILTNVGFSDPLPAGLAVASPNGLTGSCGGGAIHAAAGATTIELLAAVFDPGDTCTFSVDVVATAGGTKNNLTDPISFAFSTPGDPAAATGGRASDTVDVTKGPTATAAFGASSVRVGAGTSLTFKLDNPNATTALSGIGFSSALPAGLVVASPTGLTGSCGAGTIGATAGGSTVSLTGGALAAGASCTFSIDVTTTSDGAKDVSTGPISSNEGGAGAAATASLLAAAPAVISKSFGAGLIGVGGSTTLSYAIINANSSTTLTGVAFSDVLPDGLVVSSFSGAATTCGGTFSAAGSTIALTGTSLAPGTTCLATVYVTGTSPGVKTSTSSPVQSDQGGAGNTATATIVVAAPPAVSITTPADGATYAKGQSVTASYGCAEGASGPGLAACTGTVANGAAIDTASAGKKSFTVTARSGDGQTTTRTVTYTVAEEIDNSFSIAGIKAHGDGSVKFKAKLPGPGTLDVLETAAKSSEPGSRAAALEPGPGMFTFGEDSLKIEKAGRTRVKLDPTSRGKKLADDRTSKFRINLYVTFTPTGGEPRTVHKKVTIP
jgi:uncharacterized repeat protein (TIGR01451 family)